MTRKKPAGSADDAFGNATMLYFALASEPESDEPQLCSICGKDASIRDGERLLCSTCALKEVAPSPDESPAQESLQTSH